LPNSTPDQPQPNPPVVVNVPPPAAPAAPMPEWWQHLPMVWKSFLQLGFAGLVAGLFIVVIVGALGLFKKSIDADRERADRALILLETSIADQQRSRDAIEAQQRATNLKIDAAMEKSAARTERSDAKTEALSAEVRSLTNAVTALASEVRASRSKAEAAGLNPRVLGSADREVPLRPVYHEPAPPPRPAKEGG
jgi:hypothetical protein